MARRSTRSRATSISGGRWRRISRWWSEGINSGLGTRRTESASREPRAPSPEPRVGYTAGMRSDSRPSDQLRPIAITPNYIEHAEGSVLIEAGRTRVICTASVEDRVPAFLRNTGKGWVTAEYGMLPRATSTRTQREASAGKVGGRTQEIQRLIGRSLRAVTNLPALGERTIWIDCDV